MPYQDKKLICRDCGKEFTWLAGEQEFFASKGFSHPPSRCKEHRFKHKAQIEGARGLSHKREFEITCANCGRKDKVPFEPTGKHSLLCSNCFMNQRAAKAGVAVKSAIKDEVSADQDLLLDQGEPSEKESA